MSPTDDEKNKKNVENLMRVGEILVEKGWITWEQLKGALEIQRKTHRRLGDILIDHGIVGRKDLYKALALQSGMAFVDLESVTPQKIAVSLVDKKLAQKYRIIPLIYKEETLLIAIADPKNEWPEDKLKDWTKIKNIRTVLASPEDIDQAILKYYSNPS